MGKLVQPEKFTIMLDSFVLGLKNIYGEGLLSVMLYGSAASGEFTKKHSNLNLAVLLNDTSLANISRSSKLINRYRFRRITPVFFTEKYIERSTDIFPIEFLDMKENHALLYGKDFAAGLKIDLKNLRFQCEQELKSKLIKIKNAYVAHERSADLKDILFGFLTSSLHILRNMLRLKGRVPPYSKEDVIRDIGEEFKIEMAAFVKILDAKKGNSRLNNKEVKNLFFDFADNLEKIVGIVDSL